MVDDVGSFGPANWRARHLRNRSEAWARSIVELAREGQLPLDDGDALSIIATIETWMAKSLVPLSLPWSY
ncbi:hypothetical protein N2599_23740 (plasmid) [Rhizobium sullae]|uniref:Uncharacterized protein n=1 Tax=Rhizobium sullae TaxID=50338 RepID=A0A2N0D7Y9_RHISU|nr:hypothetical protein [Rhizobium sullae]PKA42225.1 hypothetical protein CWR43_19165 [Rhizobium sullae]UWU18267.1 hypothetical protein N2599_23740 [Rhizobium sullae]